MFINEQGGKAGVRLRKRHFCDRSPVPAELCVGGVDGWVRELK